MKKITKSALSVLLCLAMVLTTAVSAFAYDFKRTDLLTTNFGVHSVEDADEVQYPAIILPGLSFSKYYLLDDNGNRVLNTDGEEMFSGSFILDVKALIKKAIPLVFSVVGSAVLRRDIGFSEKVFDLMTFFTQYELCDEDGNPLYNLELETYDYPIAGMDAETKQYYYDNIPVKDFGRFLGEDMIYIYTYCPFGEVMSQAQGLVPYIDMVLEQTGAEKVNLFTMSMGTTIMDAFMDLDETDYSKLNRIVNVVPMFDGNEVITELLAKDFSTDDHFYACEFIPNITEGLLGGRALGYALNILLRVFPSKVRSNVVTALYDGLGNAFKYSSQAWTMVQSARYDELRSMYLVGESHDHLRANIDRFFEAQSHIEENLLRANREYSVGVYNVVGYGTHSLASLSALFSIIASDAETNADCLVPLSSSSLGATHCGRKETLSDSYIASLETTEYLSPDRTVDASTCLFPDTTWFYYRQIHWAGGNDAAVNLAWILTTGIIKDIHSDPENYPQFNGARDLLPATDQYMYMAEEVLKNPGAYKKSDVEKVQKAFDALTALYKKTNLNYEGADKEAEDACYALGLALSKLGLCEKPEKKTQTPVFESILEKICERMYKTMGRKGYLEF